MWALSTTNSSLDAISKIRHPLESFLPSSHSRASALKYPATKSSPRISRAASSIPSHLAWNSSIVWFKMRHTLMYYVFRCLTQTKHLPRPWPMIWKVRGSGTQMAVVPSSSWYNRGYSLSRYCSLTSIISTFFSEQIWTKKSWAALLMCMFPYRTTAIYSWPFRVLRESFHKFPILPCGFGNQACLPVPVPVLRTGNRV